MPLPTTALTLHLDASVNSNLWKFYDAGSPYHNSPPTNNDSAQTWDDAEGNPLTLIGTAGANGAMWRSTTPLMVLPNIDFITGAGSSFELWDTPGVVAKPLSTIISDTAFVVLAAFRIEGGATNFTDPWLNDGLVADSASGGGGGYWGIHVRNNSDVYTVQCLNYTAGGSGVVALNANIDTDYVLVYWHVGSSIFGELYDSTGLVSSGNTTSGTTQVVSGQLIVGSSSGTPQWFNGRLGKFAAYNAHNATDRADATTEFRTLWLGGAPASSSHAGSLLSFFR